MTEKDPNQSKPKWLVKADTIWQGIKAITSLCLGLIFACMSIVNFFTAMLEIIAASVLANGAVVDAQALTASAVFNLTIAVISLAYYAEHAKRDTTRAVKDTGKASNYAKTKFTKFKKWFRSIFCKK